jgi:hypothetical protein
MTQVRENTLSPCTMLSEPSCRSLVEKKRRTFWRSENAVSSSTARPASTVAIISLALIGDVFANVKSTRKKIRLTLEICGRRLVQLVSEGAPVVGVAGVRSLSGVAQGVAVALACNNQPISRLFKFKRVHFLCPDYHALVRKLISFLLPG